jgi:hypothetical protein
MSLILSGSDTDFNFTQAANAPIPMYARLSGSETLANS